MNAEPRGAARATGQNTGAELQKWDPSRGGDRQDTAGRAQWPLDCLTQHSGTPTILEARARVGVLAAWGSLCPPTGGSPHTGFQ